MASGAVLEVATLGGYSIAFGFHEAAGLSLIASGCAMAVYNAQDIKTPNISWKNTNPYDGPVDEEVFVGDAEGNIIPVDEGQWLSGSEDGKWIQVKEPSDNPRGKPTGTRIDGGHPKGPKHPDPRGWEPHGHRPGISNPDGTPWLPIN
jgi:hypothetical protein